MNMSTLGIALLIAILVWVYLVRYLTAKPWLHAGQVDNVPGIGRVDKEAQRIGLYWLLGIIGSFFLLFISAYWMRMADTHAGDTTHGLGYAIDWMKVTKPPILWFNTGVLVLASVAMEFARRQVALGKTRQYKLALRAGGLLTLAFIVGQLTAWEQFRAQGYLLTRSPSVAFFYVLTALHVMHLLGGLFVWLRTSLAIWKGADASAVTLTVQLCAIYWHFLLLVWLVLFWLLQST